MSPDPNRRSWMLYGAYGYTGQLIVEEALRRGHRPVLAGRSPEKLLPLAEGHDLQATVIDLESGDELVEAVAEVDLVFHAAGPFIHTSMPMVRACLEAGSSYLDIAGEVLVFQSLLALDKQAKGRGIAIIPGVGFNVLATDCLTLYVIRQLEEPIHLEIATSWISDGLSRGSFKTMIESFPVGTLIRRDGELVRASVRKGRRRVRFIDKEREVVPVSLGDLSTAYSAYGIPNIETFTAIPDGMSNMYAWSEPIYRKLFASAILRKMAKRLPLSTGANKQAKDKPIAPSQAWVRVSGADGVKVQAMLETPDSYHFTAAAGVHAVENVIAKRPQGALTPAQAFDSDFVLEIPGTRRPEPAVSRS